MQKKRTEHNDVLRVTLLKGIAIIAVVVIHIFSSLPGKVFTLEPNNLFFIIIDQICRLSVPLFFGLSGYALTKKYHANFTIATFYKRRVFRLIPLYLLWSVGLWLLFIVVKEWYSTSEPTPWWQVVFLGRGDYHLYFVPLIFQFYLLFPFLLKLLNRSRIGLLLIAIVVQLVSLLFLEWHAKQPGATFFVTDQAQYSMLISWISYFVMGMVLAKKSPKNAVGVAGTLFVLSGCFMAWQAVTEINNGLDPLYALKFTRSIVQLYGLSAIILFLNISWENFKVSKPIMQVWKKVGELSFIIFLSHTLVLRLIFGRNLPGLSHVEVLLGIIFLISALFISYKLEQRK